MTADDFRDIALGMQSAVERAHMNHPDFRANGRIFATLAADEQSGVVMLSPGAVRGAVLLAWQRVASKPPKRSYGRA